MEQIFQRKHQLSIPSSDTDSTPFPETPKAQDSYQPKRPRRYIQLHKQSLNSTEDDIDLKAFLDVAMPSRNIQTWDETSPSSSHHMKDGTQGKRKREAEDDDKEDDNDEENTIVKEETGRRLFVRNLPYSTTESDLVEAFGCYGDLTEVHLVTDKKAGKSKGLAFVEFEDTDQAHEAMLELDGSIFQGRLLHVLPSHDKPQPMRPTIPSETLDGRSYKREREARMKEASGKRAAWNTFYMRPDTVTEAVADHYGISKGALMHRDASDLGVRLALGEAQVIAKTKAALERAGIDITQLEEAARTSGKAATKRSLPRSDRIIIVKNLPHASSEEELKEMFQKYGTVIRFVMPETRTMAIVIFDKASDARCAFRGLAYTKYQSVPIYLEWAPRDLMKTPTEGPTKIQESPGMEGDTKEATGVTLYVKNLSFSTTDSGLASHFDGIASEIGGQLRSANVARKRHPNGTIVSAGFGFVEFDSVNVAKHVLQKLQGSLLDGHLLQMRFSSRKPKIQSKAVECPELVIGNKLIVKNLAFECTKNDVMEIFRPYGQITSCRLPKKFDGQHRGFAFLEFVTRQQATVAVEAMGDVHLYGRRLNVEYAKDEEMPKGE